MHTHRDYNIRLFGRCNIKQPLPPSSLEGIVSFDGEGFRECMYVCKLAVHSSTEVSFTERRHDSILGSSNRDSLGPAEMKEFGTFVNIIGISDHSESHVQLKCMGR